MRLLLFILSMFCSFTVIKLPAVESLCLEQELWSWTWWIGLFTLLAITQCCTVFTALVLLRFTTLFEVAICFFCLFSYPDFGLTRELQT